MIETNKVYEMDCLDLMKTLPDKYFNLIITDPPYGIGAKNITNNKSRGGVL
jgi:site-specific DNA-methyltransferase (adenine-specific)